MENCKEQIEALEEKIAQYDEILEKTLSEKKSINKVTAGPLDHDGIKFYRVSGEGGGAGALLSPWETDLFGVEMPEIIEVGSEVIVIGSAIAAVVPDPLVIKKELPEFDLIDWSSIGGLKSQINDIREAVELPLKNASLAKELGLTSMAGILLYGPPGCGKTLIAKAIASAILKTKKADAESFVYIKGAELLSSYVGQTEQAIARIFHNCREYSKRTGIKAIVFIDEAESLLPVRGSMRSSDVDKTIVPTFLAEMDGLDKEHNPIMLLSTNLPNSLDPAITREGRIDLKIEIKRPTESDLPEIFDIHLKKMKTADKIADLSAFGAKTVFSCEMKRKVSGAMIETVVQSAARKALTRHIANTKTPKGIIKEDLEASIQLINSNYAKV